MKPFGPRREAATIKGKEEKLAWSFKEVWSNIYEGQHTFVDFACQKKVAWLFYIYSHSAIFVLGDEASSLR
jgi:Txe/YoeB family toxin of Txe-Axe toxin-antitoxin module